MMDKKTLLFGVGIVGVAAVLLMKALVPNKSKVTQETAGAGNKGGIVDQQAIAPAQSADSNSWYTDYSPEALTAVAAAGQKAVIFFYAGWCPSCKAAAADFEANRQQIPAEVTILKADYDNETELKKKYGVVAQDTFVQVDSQGREVGKWNSGGEGVKALLANVK